ncbi:hypothetical protein IC582_022649 [Cucumis melo]|uniref:Uncharacterized protein LOC103489534 n=2 Tax=Cucumis melo TaxID=3656 RepID=A0A1S3BH89_CUCME|nr:protein MAINTENANCE OF PSII UNDER HIGH LIGHT 1 [Cucumis melo]KAA0034777.1 uncharacterized protein E6C27_scaffold65G008040 [Cucumis melo var. makuwa]
MACASQTLIAANSCSFPSHRAMRKSQRLFSQNTSNLVLTVRASSEDSDCNVDECAPDKEVGKISMEWLAGEKTKVVGTYPPRRKGWTGYVEKDTAGQTNIYSVEPVVYVAESAISSGTAGSSSEGAENTLAIAGGIALIAVAAASSILLQVGKKPPEVKTVEYTGPSLSYYINKFNTREIVQPVQSEPESSSQVDGVTPEVTEIQSQSDIPAPEVTDIQVESQTTAPSSSAVSSVS